MVGGGGRGRTEGERMSKRKFRMRKCKLVKILLSMNLLFCDWPAPLSYCSLLWGLHGDVPRTGQDSGLSIFCLSLYGKADLPNKQM